MILSSRRWRILLLGLVIACGASPAHAGATSQRYLQRALHEYQAGRYENAQGLFMAVVNVGTAKERSVALSYLKKPEFERMPKPRRRSVVSSSEQRTERLLLQAISFYAAGNYALARPGLKHVAQKGTPRQQTVARNYLDQPAMKNQVDDLLEEPPDVDAAESEESSLPQNFRLSGYVDTFAAMRTQEPRQATQWKSTALLAASSRVSDALAFQVSGRFFYDAIYALSHRYPDSVADDQRAEAVLRDTYVDLSHGPFDARLGRQQIVWGEATGLFFADVVNAKDLREFILPDFASIRTPQWAADLEYSREAFHAEAVWIPFLEFDQVGRPGSEFAFHLPVPAGLPYAFAPERKPGNSLKNGEWGGRLSYLASGWDLSTFVFRTWDKFPIYESTFDGTTLLLTPTHPRLSVGGFTVAKELGDVVLKTESVFYRQKYFSTSDPTRPNGILPKDVFEYMFSAERALGRFNATLQWSQRHILDYERSILVDRKRRSDVAISLSHPFLNNRLEPQCLAIKNMETSNLMLRPKIGYKVGDHWQLTVGMDWFEGPEDGFFGQFANRDRGYGDIRYSF